MWSRLGLVSVAAIAGGAVALGSAQVVHATSTPATTYFACIDANNGLNVAQPDGTCPGGQTPTSWLGQLPATTTTQLTKTVAANLKTITAAQGTLRSSQTQLNRRARKIAALHRKFSNETSAAAKDQTLSDMSELTEIELQDAMQQRSKVDETLANLMKSLDSTDSSIVKNLK